MLNEIEIGKKSIKHISLNKGLQLEGRLHLTKVNKERETS